MRFYSSKKIGIVICCVVKSHHAQGLYGQGKSGENISFSRWSGKVREFNEKVRENLEKVKEIFLESSYLL